MKFKFNLTKIQIKKLTTSFVIKRKIHVDGYTKVYVHGVGTTTSELARCYEGD